MVLGPLVEGIHKGADAFSPGHTSKCLDELHKQVLLH